MTSWGLVDAFLATALAVVALLIAHAYRQRAQLYLWFRRLVGYFDWPAEGRDGTLWPLFWLSVASLFIEVMLIRWIGTEIRIFAYFQNLALIACFLGFGLGCLWSLRSKSLFFTLASLGVLVLLVLAPFATWRVLLTGLSDMLSLSPDAALWGPVQNLPAVTTVLLFEVSLVILTVFLLLVVVAMIPLGQWVGTYLDAAPDPVRAYTVNLAGSLLGIWALAGLALAWLRPEWWFVLALALVVVARRPGRRLGVAGLVVLLVTTAAFTAARAGKEPSYWSPYQKLQVESASDHQYLIKVNNTGYMTIANTTPEALAHAPRVAQTYYRESSYDAPFRFAKRVDRVLIVGAGAGNDASGALRHGAQRVDAVEIDPVIYYLGRTLHPDRPYQSPRVRVIQNDARAFLRRAQGEYDVIVFGLLDSHTQYSDYSNMRLDSFVYTEEAFRQAARLLQPDGILVVKFEVRPPWTWMGQRLFAMLERVFDRPPVVFYAAQLGPLLPATVFVASRDPGLWQRARQPELAQLISESLPDFPLTLRGAPAPTTDDWPYMYHRGHTVPVTYLTVSLLLVGLSVFLVRGSLEPKRASTWEFFFLGAGFLLLETQLVNRLALYFGTTWLVNCFALTTILLVLILANLYVARRPSSARRLRAFYLIVVFGLLANFLFPWDRLTMAASEVGWLLCGAFGLPLFFAGVIFTEKFRTSESKSATFGANIVGAVAGGLAQNLSYLLGMKFLLVIAAVFYFVAALSGELEPRRAAETAALGRVPV